MTNLTIDAAQGWPDRQLAEVLDAAQTFLLEDKSEEAVAIWQQLISEGGEAGDWGHLEFADYLLRSEQDDEARAELAALMADGQKPGIPWLLAAGLLEDRGQNEEALRWYSAAVSALPGVDEAAPRELLIRGITTYSIDDEWAAEVRAGRRRSKWALGLPLDDNDLLARIDHAEAHEKVRGLSRLLSCPQVIDGRLQFRSRRQIDELNRLGLEMPAWYPDIYYRLVEHEIRSHGSGRVLLLPRHFDELSPHVRAALGARSMAELASVTIRCDEDDAVEWPPRRNQRCWCGSGTKYKKCCGGPSAAVGF
jgi:hypothetical protein